MILYLIKSGLCLLVLYSVYHFVLGSEKMYRFNRYFLLTGLVFGLPIPLNIIEKEAIPTEENQAITATALSFGSPSATLSNSAEYLNTENAIIAVYLCISLLFLLRFTRNLRGMLLKIRNGNKIRHGKHTLVLTDEKVLPYTFLHYIFINEEDFNRNQIEAELLEHEMAHARQYHSIDIIFMELLQVFFWFQPALYGFKKALQYNHEFLADEAVLQQAVPTEKYQTLILAKITPIKPVPFSSNLAYLVTKKRFLMMTKHTPALKSSLLKLAVLPLIAALTASFSTYEEAEPFAITPISGQPKNEPAQSKKHEDGITDAEYFAGVRINVYEKFDGFKGINLKWSKTYEEFTPEDFQNYGKWFSSLRQKPLSKKSPTPKELNDFKNSKKYAIWIDGVNVSNNRLNNYQPSDFAHFSGSVILKNARTQKHPQPFQYWFFTHHYYEKNKMGEVLKKYPGDKIDITITKKPEAKEKEVAPTQETKNPDFPGGLAEFMKYFANNFNYPKDLKTAEALRLVATFKVTNEGTLNDIQIVKGHSPEVDSEIIRVLKASPKWIPGEKEGKKVDAQMTLPIQLQPK